MAEYKGRPGVWVIYSRDHDIVVDSVHDNSVRAIEALGNTGNSIAFIPFGETIRDGVEKWEDSHA